MGCIFQKQQKDEGGNEGSYVEFNNYIGEKNCCGQRNGKGQYYYDNGDMYDGFWKRNKKHGYGRYTYLNGKILEGFFEDDEYVGEFAPSEIDENRDDPLPRSAGSRPVPEPMINTTDSKEEREERKRKHQKKIEELKKKYGVVDT